MIVGIKRVLPRGGALPDDTWARRHRGIMALLWGHAIAIPVYGAVMGFGTLHLVLESLIIPGSAAVAVWGGLGRRARTVLASIGLLSSSAVLVHLSGGLIEMHFHFFVMVAVVALYQDWLPFLTAIGYVFVHHGALAAVDPTSVYNHPAALAKPWLWAGIHALFVTGMSLVCLVTWRLNESMLDQRREAEERLRRETRTVERLNEVGKALAAQLDLRSVMQMVTDASTELSPAEFGAFFYNVTDASGESYSLYTISGAPEGAFARFPMPRKTRIFAETFDGKGIVRIDDVTADPRYGKNPPYNGMPQGHLPVRSYLAVPVRSRGGEVLGGLFFGHPEPARFTVDDEMLVAGIAAHASVAIDNARLYESEHRAREAAEQAHARLALLADASTVLASSLELEEILGKLAETVVPAIADTCMVYLVQDDGQIHPVAGHATQDVLRLASDIDLAPVPPDDASPVAECIRRNEPLLFTDVDEALLARTIADDDHRELVQRLAPTSAILVPLRSSRRTYGALALGTVASSERRLGERDRELAEELARRAASAIENASLFADQRTAAVTLQHSLLPDALPEIPGVETAVRYSAGGPGAEVGGDWYDVMELSDGSIGVVMGDVVGRGVKAAALMGQLRNGLRALALEGHAPGEAISRLNRMLNEVGPAEAMATVLYCVYDLATGTLRVANAGHPPPLIVGVDGEATYFHDGLGLPLGTMSRTTYPEAITTIAAGAALVMYTDGLVEGKELPLAAGLETLRSVAAGGIDDLEAFCEAALQRRRAEGTSQDDTAMLVLRPMPLGDRIALAIGSRPRVLAPLRATLRRWLAALGVTEEAAYDILLACDEACANAIRHGRRDGGVTIEAEADGTTLSVRVRSMGPWREREPDDGGRGLAMMRRLMSSVEVERDADHVLVTMRCALDRSAAPVRST